VYLNLKFCLLFAFSFCATIVWNERHYGQHVLLFSVNFIACRTIFKTAKYQIYSDSGSQAAISAEILRKRRTKVENRRFLKCALFERKCKLQRVVSRLQKKVNNKIAEGMDESMFIELVETVAGENYKVGDLALFTAIFETLPMKMSARELRSKFYKLCAVNFMNFAHLSLNVFHHLTQPMLKASQDTRH
jgi:hypothetical protein